MKEGLLLVKKCIEKVVSKNEINRNILSMKIAIEGHITRVF